MTTASYIDGMSNADYHAHPSLSKSSLDRIAMSPAHYRAGYSSIGGVTARIGAAFHLLVLEGIEPVIAIDCARRSKDDRAKWAAWMDKHGADGEAIVEGKAETWMPAFERETGIVIVTPEEADEAKRMRDSIAGNPLARDLLMDSKGVAERSLFGEIDGVPFRARPDRTLTERAAIVDLKTCRSSARHDFRRACSSHRYHVQDIAYSTLHHQATGEWPEFWFVAVEKAKPFACAVYRLDDAARENGHYLMTRDLATYRACVESGEWPGYENDDSLDIPIYERETFALDFGGELTLVA